MAETSRPSAMDRRTKAAAEPVPDTKCRPGADRLSALSDELLLHVLSFLRIREAVSTCCLSRRWRYLYHYLSSLDFSEDWDHASAWFIDRVLLLHATPSIEIFRLSMRLEGDDSCLPEFVADSAFRQIDSRLLFAVRRGVRVFDLDIHHVYDPCEPRDRLDSYGLPPWVFHCRTLEEFSVHRCHLRLPSHIRLASLKKMRLGLTTFHNDELKHLLLGCPLLQRLELVYCNGTSNLVIDARENRKLEELVIHDGIASTRIPFSATVMQICAPSVKYITFNGTASRRGYEVRDLSSLVVASFNLDENRVLSEAESHVLTHIVAGLADVFTTGLLLRIHQVQVLKLSSWSLQALAIRELQGNLVSALPGVTRLELTIGSEEQELQAIHSALQACSKLRTLVLCIRSHVRTVAQYDYSDSEDSDETESPQLLALDSDIVMQDLKTIVIQGLTRYSPDPAEEGSAEEGSEEEDIVAQKEENDIVLIGFLLKVSPVLEKLIVRPPKGIATVARKWELFFNLLSDLLSLPRASSKAQVIIDEK